MVKAKLYRQNHTQKHTHTHSQKEKKGKNIYISLLPKSTSSIWDDSLSIQVFHRCRVHLVDCGDLIHCSWGCWEKFPFLFFVCTGPRFSFGFGPSSACRSPEGICSSLSQDGVKEAADSGALAHSGRGERGVRMQGKPVVAEASVTLHQPEAHPVFSRGSCPWITGPWRWLAAQAPGRGGVESDLCLHTGFFEVAAAALVFHAHLWDPCW